MVTTDDWRLKESESSEEEAENLERKGKPHSYARRLVKGDTYGTLLILIIITYALMAALDHSLWFRTVTGACFGLALVLALHTSKIRNKVYRYGAIAVVVAAVVINASAAIRGKEYFFGASYVITILIIAAPFVILGHILRHPIINLETVIGAIDAYMLIAIAFAAVYAAMDKLLESNFFVQGPQQPMHFLYFSFVTITTLGFGDLTPATDPGRVLVSLEAVLGQIFLVTIVALLVSNLGKEKRRVPMHLDDMQDMGGTVED